MLRKPYWFVSVLPWLFLSASGCHSWVTVSPSVPNQPLRATPTRIHVVQRSGPAVTLDYASVRGDSLIGFVRGQPDARLAIPLADLRTVQVRKFNTPRTLALVIGLGVLAFATAVFVGISRMGDD